MQNDTLLLYICDFQIVTCEETATRNLQYRKYQYYIYF